MKRSNPGNQPLIEPTLVLKKPKTASNGGQISWETNELANKEEQERNDEEIALALQKKEQEKQQVAPQSPQFTTASLLRRTPKANQLALDAGFDFLEDVILNRWCGVWTLGMEWIAEDRCSECGDLDCGNVNGEFMEGSRCMVEHYEKYISCPDCGFEGYVDEHIGGVDEDITGDQERASNYPDLESDEEIPTSCRMRYTLADWEVVKKDLMKRNKQEFDRKKSILKPIREIASEELRKNGSSFVEFRQAAIKCAQNK